MTMKHKKKLLIGFIFFALMLALPGGVTVQRTQAAVNYTARASKAKKLLPKKIVKLLRKGYYKPSARIISSKKSGKKLTCHVQGAIGDGAYMLTARVNLKSGKVTITDSMVYIKSSFRLW